jgi:3-methyladenine DNA glycosylase AlkD
MFYIYSAMPTNLHAEILLELKKNAGHGTAHSGDTSYLGNAHFSYHISTPVKRKIAKAFLKERCEISPEDFLNLLNGLFKAKSFDEKAIATELLGHSATHRKHVTVRHLDSWLDHLEGWAEVDSLCYSNFAPEEILSQWKEWKAMLVAFSKHKNIHKRRASLVLLTRAVSYSPDPRFSILAFQNIDRLKREKHILITKAISWLLRSLIRHHRKEVAAYLKANAATLPKIAIRETQRKLLTGRK